MRKIYFLSTIMLIMMAAVWPLNAEAQNDVSVWDGFAESWTQGDGTENNPYLIENARQLAYIAEMVNVGITHYDSTYFKLTTNVLIDSTTAWEPIGLDGTFYFAGHFDGNNHIVTIYFSTSYMQYVGIFGYAKNGSISNLVSTGQVIRKTASETAYAGGICGYSRSVVSNCHNFGNIFTTTSSSNSNSCSSYSGGICGYSTAVVSNCHNTGNIFSSSSSSSSSSSNSYSLSYSGGICGYSTVAITNSHNTGNISSSSSFSSSSSSYSSSQYSYSYSGGINGYSNSTATITNCYNTGIVTSYSQTRIDFSISKSYSGGIYGYSNSTASITNCYNTGDISSTSHVNYSYSTAYSYSSGICGYCPYYAAIMNCYNVGSLSGSYRNGIGIQSNITNCYYLNTCGSNTSTGGTPKTEAQMKSPSFPIILNSDSVVYAVDTLNINQGYPIFANAVYVLTQDAENVGFTSATLNGVYNGGADIKGFKYKQESDSVFTTVYCSLNSPFSYDLTGLLTGTTYQYVYFIQKNGLTYYGDTKTFTTTTCDIAVNITKQTNAICMGDSVSLVAQAQSAYSSQFTYVWSTGESGEHISPNQNGQYTVTASAGNGCEQTQTYSLSLYPSPVGMILGDTVLCVGDSVTLTASGAWSYQWDNGHTGATISVAAPGAYSCTFTNEYGCTSENSVTVTSFSNFSIAGNPHICSGEATVLNAPAADSCLWNNGAQSFSIMVTEPGIYGVTLYHGTCEAYAEVEVTPAPLPTPTILGNTTFCQGETTPLTANGGTSYVWSNASTGNSISVNQSGVYTVTATNAEGCSASTNVTVTVNPLPNVNITGNSSFCQGDNTTLTATGASTYAWSNSQTINTITVSNAGTYTVTGTDANGCANTDTKTISVNPTYNIPLTHSICQGESYNFHGQNLTTAGTYTHTLQTVNGCDSVLTLTLTVMPQPNVTITGNTLLCEGQSTVLTANGGVSYAWSNDNTNNSINVAQSGVYTVTATNVEGCSATATANVTVNPLPIVVISGNTSICEGGSTTLTASGADAYNWSTGDNTASATISAFGIYTVTGTSVAGCSSVASVTVLVSQLPVITITGETDICAGESTTLTANGGTSYLWSNGNTNASLTVSSAGTYQVIGYNEAGCNAMASATVNVWQPATSEFSVECPDPCYTWNDIDYCTSGDYTQTLQTVHGCDSVVTLHLTITVGVDDHDGFDFKVYPNPTSNIVNVECIMKNEEWSNVELYLCDAYGRLLDVVRANNHSPLQTAQIDLSGYANGIYFVKAVANGDVVAVRKVVKQ